MNQEVLEARFNYWLEVNQVFVNEKTTSLETGRQVYRHKKLRSAFNSIRNNLPYLFTYKQHKNLNIPNTTNSLDGWFAHLRKLLNYSSGLVRSRRDRII